MSTTIFWMEKPMNTNTRKKIDWSSAVEFAVGLFALILMSSQAIAQQVPVSTNIPMTVSGDVIPGAHMLEIPFVVDGADGITVEAIVPVNGAAFSLIDPSGFVVLTSGNSGVEFISGIDLQPEKMLPGGVFATEEIAKPGNGTWKIRLDFPPAPEKTAVIATIFVKTAIQAGIAVTRESYLTGEEASIGMLILDNGQPVTGLNPQISVSLLNSGNTADIVEGLDNGVDPDGLADDGVYSRIYTFPTAGQYLIKGTANISTQNGLIGREASRTVTVTNPPLTVTSVTANTIPGPGGCIDGVEEAIALNINTAGEYVFNGKLQSNSGKEITLRERRTLVPGTTTVSLFYSGKDIVQSLGENGPFNLSSLDVLSVSNESFTLAARKADLGSTPNITLTSICKDPIEIGTNLSVNTSLQDSYIKSLEFMIPVTVQSSGNYQMSFKVIGSGGEDIQLVAFTRSLTAGMNEVKFSVNADRFQAADGPYGVISALVIGSGKTAQKAFVGESLSFQRWQFLPTKPGDLDADGDVDDNDRNVVLNARNSAALVPGDRRDIVRDGIIDLKDARAILRLR